MLALPCPIHTAERTRHVDPQRQFCHNLACPASGQVGQGNIGVQSQQEQRYLCHTCGRTFAATTGTAFYRLRTAADQLTLVLTLLSHGCPPQAIVAAFGLDECTVAAWLARAGGQCQQEQGSLCHTCGRTCAPPRGTAFYRLRPAADQVTLVLTRVSHGCPPQAIVAAFGLDERTVAAWLARAGGHCQQVHEHLVQHGAADLTHVQADELWVKLEGQRVWMALARVVPSRLWPGGTISPHR